jgi:hypothetical protein
MCSDERRACEEWHAAMVALEDVWQTWTEKRRHQLVAALLAKLGDNTS